MLGGARGEVSDCGEKKDGGGGNLKNVGEVGAACEYVVPEAGEYGVPHADEYGVPQTLLFHICCWRR